MRPNNVPALILVAGTLFVLPGAQADPVTDALEGQPCDNPVDMASCHDDLRKLLDDLCSPQASTCFICAKFRAGVSDEIDLENLVDLNPFGDDKMTWFGYNYHSTHDVLVAGEWTISSSRSQGTFCDGHQGAGAPGSG